MSELDNTNQEGKSTPESSQSSNDFAPPSGSPIAGSDVQGNGSAQVSGASQADGTTHEAACSQASGDAQESETPKPSAGTQENADTQTSNTTYSMGRITAGQNVTRSSGQVSASVAQVTGSEPAYAPAATGANQVIYGKSKSGGSSYGKTFLIAFAGALVACVLAIGAMFTFGAFDNSGTTDTLGSTSTNIINASDEDSSLAEVVASECLPSVVSIDVLGTQSSGTGNSLYDYLYGFGESQSDELSEIGLGSGVIISDDGYIITNYHVIEDGQQFDVTVAGEQYEAELIGSDSSSDIAVLKIKDGSGFKAISLGDSSSINIGEWVMSIGSPFGLEQSVATGIVSATSRSQILDSETDSYGQSTGEVTIYPNMIQTDAAINPGNSGGALVNSQGQLIGINTLITSYSGNYSGVGFAIPSNYAISIAQSLIAGEEPSRAFLGITMTTINSSIAQMYGFSTDSGAYVSSVVSGSAADEAGIKVGDIITAFDGEAVTSASDIMLDVRSKSPGDKVTLTYVRDGQEQTAEVTLSNSEDFDTSTEDNSTQNDSLKNQDKNSGNGSNSTNPFGL